MQLIPPSLVPTAQALISQQGGNPNIIDSSGGLDAGAVLGMFFNQVEIRTSMTPSLIFPITSGGPPPSSVMQSMLQSLQPTVIFTGPAGREVVAPYGASQGASSWLPLMVVGGALVLGIGYLFWD